MMKAALVQLSSGDDPAANLVVTRSLIDEAASGGATLIQTPEVTNLLTPDPDRRAALVRPESQDATLAALRQSAADHGVWLIIGSLSLREDRGDDQRLVNRSFLIDPAGEIVARYDKIHMFDVAISETETFSESTGFRPGDQAVVGQGDAPIGMSVCYDLRFPHLYRRLTHAGAEILSIPAAFNPTTGAAHWDVLLRARAIENGAFVLAAAQCGVSPSPHTPNARPRRNYGHSTAVAPWGEVLVQMGDEPGVALVDLDLSRVAQARSQVPAWRHDPVIFGP